MFYIGLKVSYKSSGKACEIYQDLTGTHLFMELNTFTSKDYAKLNPWVCQDTSYYYWIPGILYSASCLIAPDVKLLKHAP